MSVMALKPQDYAALTLFSAQFADSSHDIPDLTDSVFFNFHTI